MIDPEFLGQQAPEFHEDTVLVMRLIGLDMGTERNEARCHCPNVQIVDAPDPGTAVISV